MKRIYSIATNRPLIHDFLLSYLDEICFIQNTYNKSIPLVIIDESTPEIQEYNHQMLSEIKNKEVEIYHFNYELQVKLFEHIRKYLKSDDIVRQLDYSGFSYARAMNKQFLAANVFKSEYIHRRDSDVKIMPEQFGYPAEYEVRYLGKKISTLDNILNKNGHKDEQIVYLVGSGYSGNSDWKADFGVFKEQDFELIKEITDLFNYGKKLSEEYLNEIIFGNVNVKGKYKLLPYRNHPNPICGNISFYKIFNYLPCGTQLDTIGSDNLIREFLKEIHSPIVYHNSFVYHKFDLSRDSNDINYLIKYWPRVINKLIFYKCIKKIILKQAQEKYSYISDIDKIPMKRHY